MKAARLWAIAAATLVVAAAALAQTPTNPEVTPPARSINLSLEQRHIIRELVAELKTTPSPVDVKVSAGDVVPQGVELHPVPPLLGQKVPQIKAHRFFITGKQIVLVDPQENRVSDIIE
jgi:hypothetical protein